MLSRWLPLHSDNVLDLSTASCEADVFLSLSCTQNEVRSGHASAQGLEEVKAELSAIKGLILGR